MSSYDTSAPPVLLAWFDEHEHILQQTLHQNVHQTDSSFALLTPEQQHNFINHVTAALREALTNQEPLSLLDAARCSLPLGTSSTLVAPATALERCVTIQRSIFAVLKLRTHEDPLNGMETLDVLGEVLTQAMQLETRRLHEAQSQKDRYLEELRQQRDILMQQTQITEIVQQGRALLRAITDNLPAAIYVKDLHGNYVIVNKFISDILGLPYSEIIGKSCADLLPPELSQSVRVQETLVRQTGQTFHTEEDIYFQNQHYVISTTRFPLYDENGKMYATGGMMIDITERKRVEEELKRRDAILEAVSSATELFLKNLTIQRNIQTLIERLGTAAHVSRIYIYENQTDEDDTLLMKLCYEWVASGIEPHIDTPTMQAIPYRSGGFARWQEALRRGDSIQGQVHTFPPEERALLESQDVLSLLVVPITVGPEWWGFIGFEEVHQERIWSHAEIDAIKTAAGIIGAGIHRYRIQQMLDKNEAELRKLYRAVEHSPSSIIITNTYGVIEYVNPRFSLVTGYDFREVVGKKSGILKWSDTSSEHYKNLWEALSAGKEWHAEFRNTRKNGQTYWEEVSISSITNAHGNIIHLVAVQEDITERRTMQEALRKAMETAEAATRAKSEFLANMSHEIRTPLNIILGMTTLLLKTPLLPDQQEFVETIHTSGKALLGVINDILDISKIEAGKLTLDYHPFDLRACIEESLDLFATDAAQKNLDIGYLIEPGIPLTLIGDMARLRQILINLLSNAVKFTHEGEIVVHASAREMDSNGHQRLKELSSESVALPLSSPMYEIHLSVSDTGTGISQEIQAILFEPFCQADASIWRNHGGTGLGLTISKRLTNMMGGTIWVESEIGKGSTFHFTIMAQAVPTNSNSHLSEEDLLLLSKQRALIVSDSPLHCRIFEHAMRQWNIVSQIVPFTDTLLPTLQASPPFDIAILDIKKSTSESLELAHSIQLVHQNHQQVSLIVYIFVTHWIEASQHTDTEAATFLARPIKHLQLCETIVNLLSGKKASPAKHPLLPVEQTQTPEAATTSYPPLRILLAEDNLGNQKVALHFLEHIGYYADVASDGSEVLERLKQQSYDIIFMDVQMPNMDGIETTRHIRSTFPADRQPWIIAMTAHAMEGDRDICLAAGMNDYVDKPVQLNDLSHALHNVPRPTNPTKKQQLRESFSVPAQAASTQSTPLNPKMFQEFLTILGKGGPKVTNDIIGIFLRDMENRLAIIQQAFAQENMPELQSAAHSLKSLSAQIGATALSDLSQQLEILGNNETFPGTGELVAQAEEEYQRVRGALLAQQQHDEQAQHKS
jgi:PAS domain S-box-containing protein